MEEYHPDTVLSNRAVHIFIHDAIMHFRKILQCRQKKIILDKFLFEGLRSPKGELPGIFKEGDAPSKQ